MHEVVGDIGVRMIETPARRIVAVPLLGDGQRHDGHRGIGDPRDHPLACRTEKKRFAYRANHAGRRPASRSFRGRCRGRPGAQARRRPAAS